MEKVCLSQYYLIIVLLLFGGIVKGQDCTISKEVELDYSRLVQNIKSELPNPALLLSDSLLLTFESNGQTTCTDYLWVKYYKTFALLLLSQSEEALPLFHKVIRESQQQNNWEIVAHSYLSIGLLHAMLGRTEDCLRNLQEARQVIEDKDLEMVYSRYAVRYASYHRHFGDLDSTKIYSEKAIEYGLKYNVIKSITDGHLLLGIVSSDLEETVSHFQAAADLFFKEKAYMPAALQRLNIAQTYLRANQLDKATIHSDTAFYYSKLVSQSNPMYYKRMEVFYNVKASIAEAKGQIDSSLYYVKKSKEVVKISNYNTNQENINQIETKFAVEQEQEKLAFEQQRTNTLRLLIALMLLLFLVGVIGFVNNRKKGKEIAAKNKALNEALQFQSVLLSEVHHRVKNNLQLVISLLTIRSYKTTNKDLKLQLNDISNKVRSIALIHEQLYQTEVFEKINIQNYLNQLFAYFKTLDTTESSFSFEVNTNDIDLNLETIVPLGIICSELISNSLKYAQQPNETLNISLILEKDKDHFKLRYQDSGIGYPTGSLVQNPNSMGTLLIKSMVRQLMAEYDTFNKNGAVFNLSFTEKKVSDV